MSCKVGTNGELSHSLNKFSPDCDLTFNSATEKSMYVEEMRPAGNGMPKLKGFQIMSLTVMWSNIFHFHPFIFHARHRPHCGRG